MGSSTNELTVEELYHRHHVALRRFLTRILRSEDTAAEVAQDAYLRLHRFSSGRLIDDPKAYLFQIAANAARDHLSRERNRNKVMDGRALSEEIACERPDAEAVTHGKERIALLQNAIDELPPRCREVFVLSRFNHLSNGAIAEQLGISRNMVEKHIIKALLHCRERLASAN